MKITTKLLVGFALGACVPVIGFALIEMIFEQLTNAGIMGDLGTSFGYTKRLRTIAVLAIACNLIPFQYFKLKSNYDSLRGVVLATFLYAAIWVIYFWDSIIY